jgi:hypothetical protein
MMKSSFRLPVWGLMALVSICGIGLAALRYPSRLVANALFTTLIALLTVALLGVLCTRDRQRAYWTGFALCGGMYALLSLAPWFDDQVGPHLITTAVFDILSPHVVSPSPRPPSPPVMMMSNGGVVYAAPDPWTTWTRTEANPGSLMMAGSMALVSSEPFRRIGHSLFGLIGAAAGGLLARRFFDRRTDRRSEAAVKAAGLVLKVLEAGL